MAERASEQSIFLHAIGRESPEERSAYLDDACRDQPALRAEIDSRLRDLQIAAGGVAGGNLAAIGTLLNDLGSAGVAGAHEVTELRHLVSVDLGLSLAETRPCRQLVGIPV